MISIFPFRYDPEILKRFPNLTGRAILARKLKNGPAPENLRKVFLEEQRRVLEKTGTINLSEINSLAGWRVAFRSFGVDPTQYRSAAEALLRRLTKKGDIPSINALVDICNMVSIRYGLPVAGFDLRAISGIITVRFASGEEIFQPLGEAKGEHPAPGEVIFMDEKGLIVARRWCWRQSEESAAREDTCEALFTIEAQHKGGEVEVDLAIKDLQFMMSEYLEGEYETPSDVLVNW